jgi:hypothetical protein
MEISDVRRRVRETIDRAKHRASERRARNDEAVRAFALFLDDVAVPLFKQIANVLKTEGYAFTVFTPADGVRLMSDRSGDDYIEIALDTSGDRPRVMAHITRRRGRHVIEADREVGGEGPSSVGEDDLLAFVLQELEPFVER